MPISIYNARVTPAFHSLYAFKGLYVRIERQAENANEYIYQAELSTVLENLTHQMAELEDNEEKEKYLHQCLDRIEIILTSDVQVQNNEAMTVI